MFYIDLKWSTIDQFTDFVHSPNKYAAISVLLRYIITNSQEIQKLGYFNTIQSELLITDSYKLVEKKRKESTFLTATDLKRHYKIKHVKNSGISELDESNFWHQLCKYMYDFAYSGKEGKYIIRDKCYTFNAQTARDRGDYHKIWRNGELLSEHNYGDSSTFYIVGFDYIKLYYSNF